MPRPPGRPPKPTEAKQRLGNPGKRKLPPKPKAGTPAAERATPGRPPATLRPLEADGLAAWNRAWSAGAVWLSPRTDIEMVQLVCEMLDERTALRKLVLEDATLWRERLGLRALDKQIADLWSMLGFEPAARTRLGGIGQPTPSPTPSADPDPGAPPPPPDDLETARQNRAARRTGT